MKAVTIRQALQRVVDNPELNTDVLLDVPAHELVCRTLFDLANGAKLDEPRTLQRASRARDVIFNRLVGRRKAGTHPAQKQQEVSISFMELGAIDE